MMSFGISSAPEHFQKKMTALLSGLDGVLCLMDDIPIFEKDEAEHNQWLTKALQRTHSAGVTLNPNKCEFKNEAVEVPRAPD